MSLSSDPSDDALRAILEKTRTIAVIGASPRPYRDSHRVMDYLQRQGYRCIPVNPAAAGSVLLGETVLSTTDDIAEPVELVDVFRQSSALPGVIDDVLRNRERLGITSLWLQLGIHHAVAERAAAAAGLFVVSDACILVEHRRLLGTAASPLTLL